MQKLANTKNNCRILTQTNHCGTSFFFETQIPTIIQIIDDVMSLSHTKIPKRFGGFPRETLHGQNGELRFRTDMAQDRG